MVRSAVEFVIVRNEFYARSYQQIKKVVALLILIMFLLIGFAFYQNHSLKAMPRYVPTTPDGRLIEMPPVDINHLILSKQKVSPETGVIYGMPPPTILYTQLEPLGEDALVLYWAKTAVEFMFDYDYIHYRKVIQDANRYFTAPGYERFKQALIASKNLETVKARSAVVVPVVTGAIKVTATYSMDGHYAWDLLIPLQLTYESAATPDPLVQNLVAKMSVARVSTLLCPFYGLAIFRLNFQETIKDNGDT